MLSDESLAKHVLKGDMEAYEELVNRYKNTIFAIVYKIIGQYQESEDITQEVFFTVYEKLYQFDMDKRFQPWIQRIAINASITALRKKKKIISLSFDENLGKDFEANISANIPDPMTEIIKEELRLEIKQAMEELNDGYKLILMMRYQMDLNNKEIAEILNVTKEIIEVRLHRARRALRRIVVNKWTEKGLKDELPAIL